MEAVGVVFGVVGLLWEFNNKCKNGTASYHHLQDSHRSLTSLLHQAGEDLSYDGKFHPIRQIASDMERMLAKYPSLGVTTNTKNPWEQFRFSLENIEGLRLRLVEQVVMLNANAIYASPRGVCFDVQNQVVPTSFSQSSSVSVGDNDQIWYEIYQAVRASNASNRSLEAVRNMVLKSSTSHVPSFDTTPIVITSLTSVESLAETDNFPEISPAETRYSVLSSISSTSTGKKERKGVFSAFRTKTSRFCKAALDVNMKLVLELLPRVDKKTRQQALMEIVQRKDATPGHDDIVRLLLARGAHAECPDSDKRRTPLIWAILSQRHDLILPLLEGGARLETRDGRQYNTPFVWAVYTNSVIILHYLIDNGADFKVVDNVTTYTPFMLAVHLGHLGAAQLLLERDGRLIETTLKNGMSPLVIAYTKRHLAVAELLLKHGDNIEIILPSGYSLLAMAIIESQTKFVRLLVDKGASIKGAEVHGAPALTAAVKQQNPDIVRILLDKILLNNKSELDARDSKNATALLWAVSLKNERIVRILVDGGADTSVVVRQWAEWTKNAKIVQLVTKESSNVYGNKAELQG